MHYYLGLSIGTHDTAACLLADGTIIAASEQERFDRTKHSTAFPRSAIESCLDIGGISPLDLTCIAIPIDRVARLKAGAAIFKNFFNSTQLTLLEINWLLSSSVHFQCPRTLLRRHGLEMEKPGGVHFFRHHLAHAVSAFSLSGFDSAAVVVADGVGESDTVSIYHCVNNDIRLISRTRYPHSLGKFFGAICRYLGFSGPSKEGEVMGLAAHGSAAYVSDLQEMLAISRRGELSIDTSYFNFGITPLRPSRVSEKFVKRFGPPRSAGNPITEQHKNLAASLQEVTETTLLRIARRAKELTLATHLCLSGGVALNCRAVMIIREAGIFDDIFLPPAPNDAGLAIGAAYLAESLLPKRALITRKRLTNSYLGPSYSDTEIQEAAARLGRRTGRVIETPFLDAAKAIAQGCIIGWFQGRSEFGPRALGSRSILADPREVEIREAINRRIKKRQSFRPFAPAVLADAASEVFEINGASPFMTETFRVRPAWAEKIPAVVHVDGTARLQTVNQDDNPEFFQLIREFHRQTNIPLVLNTSFNGPGEPIVNSPQDALASTSTKELDCLFMGRVRFDKADLQDSESA